MLGRLTIFTPKSCAVRHGSFKNIKLLNPSASSLPFTPHCASPKPFTVTLEAGKTYSFCTCGLSNKQVGSF